MSEQSFSLVHYDAMCREIALAYKVDEVKEIRDKAVALQAYMRQIKDFDNEDRCAKIRLRAERRAAEIYDQGMKPKGGRPSENPPLDEGGFDAPSTLAKQGITSQQISRWRKLTEIPEDRFEAEIAKQRMPTLDGVYYTVFPPPKPEPVSTEALWLWGRLKEFERTALNRDPAEFLPTMTSHMLADTIDLLPRVITWLEWTRELCQDHRFSTLSSELSRPGAKNGQSARPGLQTKS